MSFITFKELFNSMLVVFHPKKGVLSVKLFVTKVAKCNQSILTSILNHYNCTNYQKATEVKDSSHN
jgi:hypothetical protein